jgi:hypothetical protein
MAAIALSIFAEILAFPHGQMHTAALRGSVGPRAT